MNITGHKTRIKSYYQKIIFFGLTGLAYFIIKNVSRSLRIELVNADYVLNGKKQKNKYIFAFWHNQFFSMPHFYRAFVGNTPLSVLTSLSKDGEYISRVIEKFGYKAIRGSSSKGGDSAIRLLLRQLQDGSDIAVTPDGPRGPKHIVQPGVITLAQLSECQIIPVGYKVNRKKTLNTWDNFIIPYPFSKTKLTVGYPISVPRNANDTEKETLRLKLQNVLIEISES